MFVLKTGWGPLLCASPILRAGQGLRERARKVHAAAPRLRLCLAPPRRSCPRGGPARRSRQGLGPVGPGAAFRKDAAPALDRREVYRRDGYRCALCDSSQGLQVHHAIARGEGGTDSPQNLITLCSYCHSHAHGRPLYDTPITAQEIAQACVEYLADYYAPDWNPWEKGRWSDG